MANPTTIDGLEHYISQCLASNEPHMPPTGRILHWIMQTYAMDRYIELERKHLEGRYELKGNQDYNEKFFNLQFWLNNKVKLAMMLGLVRAQTGNILDLGAGAGHFMLVARCLGYGVHGLDIPDPVFDDLTDFFKLARTMHRIRAFEPLPDFGVKFDFVTAFYTSFHVSETKALWGEEEWNYFLSDLATNVLTEHGKLYMVLNRHHHTTGGLQYASGEAKQYFEAHGASFHQNNGVVKFEDMSRFRR